MCLVRACRNVGTSPPCLLIFSDLIFSGSLFSDPENKERLPYLLCVCVYIYNLLCIPYFGFLLHLWALLHPKTDLNSTLYFVSCALKKRQKKLMDIHLSSVVFSRWRLNMIPRNDKRKQPEDDRIQPLQHLSHSFGKAKYYFQKLCGVLRGWISGRVF